MVAARTSQFPIVAAWLVAVLLASLSLAGLLVPGIYAREQPAWTAQALGQDWFDLLIAAPALAICGVLARDGSYRWRLVLGGAFAYTVYELLIYAFGVHFNSLFLVYCATLGLATFALITLVADLRGAASPPVERRTRHLAGGFLVGVGILFAALWLAQDLPAILTGQPPPDLAATGLFTNPVHVIDLSFVLPMHVVAGILLWRGDERGERFAPIVLAFGILMAASIGGMLVAIDVMGGVAQRPVAAVMFIIAATSSLMLARTLHPRTRALATA